MKYTRVGRIASDFLASPGSTLETALQAFGKFFKAKSGVDWNSRNKTKAPPKKAADGADLPPNEGWFEYTPEKECTTSSVSSLAA